jgi:tetratricopeptide (TPR) repeat protein
MGLQALAQSEGTVPTTTLAPTGLEKFASDADKLAGLLTSLLVTALVLLGVLALFVLAYQVVRLRFRRQLVLQDIVNASGVTELDSRIPGLSQLLREQVVEQMSHLADKVRESIAAADLASYSSLLDPTPLPRNVPDQRLNELIASMTTFASDKAGPALQLLNTVLLRPRGTKVSTTLQRQGDKPGRLGMTFEIADLTGTDVPTPMTVREVMPGKAKPKPETESAPEELAEPAGRLGRAISVFGRLLHPAARQPQSPGEADKATAAHLLLGARYEAVGALDEAMAEYVEALKAGGQNQRADELLGQVLTRERSVEARYLTLLKPAVRRLVLELAKRELVRLPLRTLVRRIPPRQIWRQGLPAATRAQRHRDQALVHNYVGLLYQTSGGSSVKLDPTLRDLAKIEFTTALQLDEELYQAHENLAYLFGWPGDETLEEENKENATSRREQALLQFDHALALLGSSRRVPDGEERLAATRLLTMGRAIMAVHLATSEDAVKQAKHPVEEIFAGWDPAMERQRRVVYNRACWYGVLLQLGYSDDGDRDRARRLLAYAMARTPAVAPTKASVDRFWDSAGADPEVKPFADEKALEELRLAIERAQLEHRQLHCLRGAEFEQVMNEVMDEVDWPEEGRTDR